MHQVQDLQVRRLVQDLHLQQIIQLLEVQEVVDFQVVPQAVLEAVVLEAVVLVAVRETHRLEVRLPVDHREAAQEERQVDREVDVLKFNLYDLDKISNGAFFRRAAVLRFIAK